MDADLCRISNNKGADWTNMRIIVKPSKNQCNLLVGKDLNGLSAVAKFKCDMPQMTPAGGPMVLNGFDNIVQFKGFHIEDTNDVDKSDWFFL